MVEGAQHNVKVKNAHLHSRPHTRNLGPYSSDLRRKRYAQRNREGPWDALEVASRRPLFSEIDFRCQNSLFPFIVFHGSVVYPIKRVLLTLNLIYIVKQRIIQNYLENIFVHSSVELSWHQLVVASICGRRQCQQRLICCGKSLYPSHLGLPLRTLACMVIKRL